MSTKAQDLLNDAYALDESDRALVRAELSEPAENPEDVRDAWVKVAVERLERYERDGGTTYSPAEVWAMARETIAKR